MTRSTYVFSLASLASIYCFGGLACSSSNTPATSASAGAPAATAGAPGAVAGSDGAGAPATGGAGAPAVTAGTGGAPDGSSGAPATTAGSAGVAGSAGAPVSGGGAGGGDAGMFTPLCAGLTTAAGPAPTKLGVCTAADTQLCYKTCGPQSVGYKTETCTAGAYAETSPSSCLFPADADYSCFKLPTTVPAACPTTTITASTACTVAACTPCTDPTGHYLDSTAAMKIGHCVCPAGGAGKWSCASDTSWPCPAGKGC